MTKRVFLLGAGFSKPADFPLANDLISFVQKHLNASMNIRDIEFKNEFSDFINGIEPSLLSNIELLLTYIDLAVLTNSVGIFIRYGSPEELRLFRMKLSGALVRAFDNAHLKLSGGNPKDEMYRKFCDILKGGEDTVITLNYDLIVEQGLWKQKKWTFLDGYGLEKDINDFQAPFSGTYPSDLTTESIIKVYKLHGSLGWIYDDLYKQIIFSGMPDYFQDARLLYCERNLHAAGKWDEGTTLIEPTYIKRFNCTPVLGIWQQAFQVLQQSNELIIIGYSLPEADAATQAFFASGVRTSQLTSITVVNPDNSVFDKFEMIFGRKIIRKRTTLEEWIEKDGKH